MGDGIVGAGGGGRGDGGGGAWGTLQPLELHACTTVRYGANRVAWLSSVVQPAAETAEYTVMLLVVTPSGHRSVDRNTVQVAMYTTHTDPGAATTGAGYAYVVVALALAVSQLPSGVKVEFT